MADSKFNLGDVEKQIEDMSEQIAKNVPNNWQYANIGVTTTLTTNNTVKNRAFSKFAFFAFFVVYNGIIRTTAILPLSAFSNGTSVSLSWVDSLDVQRWVQFQYVSDTSYAVSKSSNATETTTLYCYSIGGSQFP